MNITENTIIKIIETTFKQKKGSVNRQALIDSFAKDSMDTIEFIAILKNDYAITIEPSEITQLKTVGEVVDYALSHQQSV